jgi:hypothetical protein
MSFMAVAIGGSAVLGYAASRSATRAASAAAEDSNQTMRESAQLQYDLGKETLDFNKQYYSEVVKPTADEDLAFRKRFLPKAEAAFDRQEAFAKTQQQYYTDTFQPLERQMVRDAEGYDSSENVNRRMGIAAANVNQQYSNAADQRNRALLRMGINPNSSAFARANASLVNQQALASAGMQTGAAFDTMDKAIALRAGAANFGRNMPNTAAQFGSLANNTAGNAAGISGAGVNTAVNAGGFMNQGYGLAGNLNASGAGIDNNIFRNNIGLAQMQSQGVGQLFSGIGQGLGMWGRGGFKMPSFGGGSSGGSLWNDTNLYGADPAYVIPGSFADGGHVGDEMDKQQAAMAAANAGPAGAWTLPPVQRMANGGVPAQGGVVRGPGGPRDDAVPAMLSRNEFVFNEGAVKHFGIDKLNKMNAIGLQNQAQRGLVRSA